MRIFNHLRIKQIKEGRFGRYLTYAVGEILLVVIGILIALSINNWNEGRKSENRLDNALKMVQSDMHNDTTELASLIAHYESLEPVFLDFLSDSTGRSDTFAPGDYVRILSFYHEWNLEQNGYLFLQNISSDLHGDNIVNNLLLQYGAVYRLNQVVRDELNLNVKANVLFFRDNCSWFPQYVIEKKIEADLSDLLESTEYKNRVAYHYSVIFNNYLPVLKFIKESFAQQLQAIEERI